MLSTFCRYDFPVVGADWDDVVAAVRFRRLHPHIAVSIPWTATTTNGEIVHQFLTTREGWEPMVEAIRVADSLRLPGEIRLLEQIDLTRLERWDVPGDAQHSHSGVPDVWAMKEVGSYRGVVVRRCTTTYVGRGTNRLVSSPTHIIAACNDVRRLTAEMLAEYDSLRSAPLAELAPASETRKLVFYGCD